MYDKKLHFSSKQIADSKKKKKNSKLFASFNYQMHLPGLGFNYQMHLPGPNIARALSRRDYWILA